MRERLRIGTWLIIRVNSKPIINILMKNPLLPVAALLCLAACNRNPVTVQGITENSMVRFIDSTEMTNNFYDNTPTYPLNVNELTVEGEVENPGKVDFSELSVHSVIVKETLLDTAGTNKFVGAYRYDGYSLFDILSERRVKKANSAEFNSVIDLYVEIENVKGDRVVFSWGEIYYPNNLNRILIASGVSRIVPSKTKDLWKLPEESRIVAGNDLITERNISSPVKITVKSYPGSFNVVKGLTPMYSAKFGIYEGDKLLTEFSSVPSGKTEVTFNTVFYGRGKGIHSTQPFRGFMLKDILSGYYPVTRDKLEKGIMCFSAEDGYRCAVSYSELFNRNDQQEFLLVKTDKNEDGGLYRVFPGCDFFSDRAIKSINGIYMMY